MFSEPKRQIKQLSLMVVPRNLPYFLRCSTFYVRLVLRCALARFPRPGSELLGQRTRDHSALLTFIATHSSLNISKSRADIEKRPWVKVVLFFNWFEKHEKNLGVKIFSKTFSKFSIKKTFFFCWKNVYLIRLQIVLYVLWKNE